MAFNRRLNIGSSKYCGKDDCCDKTKILPWAPYIAVSANVSFLNNKEGLETSNFNASGNTYLTTSYCLKSPKSC